jgi:hypothetical protein
MILPPMPKHVAIILLLLTVLASAQTVSPKMKSYEGRYYLIRTDLTGDQLREADLRMTRMAEEYKKRTKDFSGTVGHKFPFFLFKNPQDYYAAGGAEGSAGYFDPNNDTLMAIAGEDTDAYTWHVVQHEGFHQYARAVIGGELPIWVNEGLAEYFGEAVFTGDGFVTGLIPQARLERVRKQFKAKSFRPIKEMMLLAHADWNQNLTMANYDQAWSMVHFLAHAENGKYQSAFVGFMRDIGTGQQWDRAWLKNFGSAEGFEQRWTDYWMKLPDSPTRELYIKAVTETVTGVLARATAQKRKFATFDDFAAAAIEPTFHPDDRDWLPPSLIEKSFEAVTKLRTQGVGFDLSPASGTRPPAIVCKLKDGKKLTGKFTLQQGRVGAVTVD